MNRLARFVVRRRRTVILAWVMLLVITAVIGSSAFSVLSTDFGAGSSTESGRVAERLDDLAESGGLIAIVADGIDLDDPSVKRTVVDGIAPIVELDGVVDVADPWSTGADFGGPGSPGHIRPSASGKTDSRPRIANFCRSTFRPDDTSRRDNLPVHDRKLHDLLSMTALIVSVAEKAAVNPAKRVSLLRPFAYCPGVADKVPLVVFYPLRSNNRLVPGNRKVNVEKLDAMLDVPAKGDTGSDLNRIRRRLLVAAREGQRSQQADSTKNGRGDCPRRLSFTTDR